MKRFFMLVLLISTLIVGIPFMVYHLSPSRVKESGTLVSLYLHRENKIIHLPLEEYLIGVVAAEMPATFPFEALKAQAVAARTYVVKRMGAGGIGNPIHAGAVVCDDHRHYQAWISREEMKKRWGTLGFYEYYFKLARAVSSTRGEMLTYEGLLIDPVYHASCGGLGTESAGDVWRFDVPYLKSAACPYDSDPEPKRTALLKKADVEKALQTDINAFSVSAGGGKNTFFEVLEETGSGRPKTVNINGKTVSAVVVRDLLGLRSTKFELAPDPQGVKVTTTGYGHAVGMCQYGAKGLAMHGKKYDEILKHYYTGVELTKINMR